MTILSWVFGILGMFTNILIYQQKTRKRLLLAKLGSDCCWGLHYGFLGAWSGMAICVIGTVRETIFINEKRKWARGKKWLIVFMALSVLSAIVTWKNAFSLLPAIGSILAVFSFWVGSPKLTRILAIPISTCFIIYDLFCYSYVGLINESIVIISTVVAIIRSAHMEKAATQK